MLNGSIGGRWLDRHAIQMVVVLTPMVVGSGRFRELDVVVKGFGVDDISLTDRCVKDGKG